MAQYRWNRVDGKPFSSRVEITNHGRVLRIEKAQLADTGRLRCAATNSFGASTAEINLVLKGEFLIGIGTSKDETEIVSETSVLFQARLRSFFCP